MEKVFIVERRDKQTGEVIVEMKDMLGVVLESISVAPDEVALAKAHEELWDIAANLKYKVMDLAE